MYITTSSHKATKRHPTKQTVGFQIHLKGAIVQHHHFCGVLRRTPSRGNCTIFEAYAKTPDELWEAMCGVKATLARVPHDLCQRCALQLRAPDSKECFMCALDIRPRRMQGF
mgnify:CR=1 FL=1